jgi:hypothetical protein
VGTDWYLRNGNSPTKYWDAPCIDLCLNAEFLDEIQTIVLRVCLLAIQSHVYSFALRFLFLQTHTTSYRFFWALMYTVIEKGGKPDRKSHPLPYDLRNPYRNLKIMPRNIKEIIRS